MVLFEVEQKFKWTLAKFNILRQGLPHPHQPLFKLENLKCHRFRDTYYDSNKTLSDNGLWVRQRQPIPGPSKWQAKQSQGTHSFLRSTYEETEDPNRIFDMVRQHFPKAPEADHQFGLGKMCQFVTTRHSFVAKEKFTVVLDEMDFGHRVGEVELLAEDADQAHADIDSLVEEHAWFFDAKTSPKGKLTAYFEKFGYPGKDRAV